MFMRVCEGGVEMGVVLNGGRSRRFGMKKWPRQGCPFICLLFCLTST